MDRRDRTLRRLMAAGEILRIIFLALCVMALGSVLIWNFRPGLVASLDKRIIDTYENHYKLRLQGAEELVRKSRLQEAQAALEDLAGDLSDVKKEDRLAETYTNVMIALAGLYRDLNQTGLEVKTVETLVGFNDKDYRLWLLYFRALARNREAEKAISAIYRAHHIVPFSLPIVEELAVYLDLKGMRAEAANVVKDYLEANKEGIVEVELSDIHKLGYYVGPINTYRPQRLAISFINTLPVSDIPDNQPIVIHFYHYENLDMRLEHINIHTSSGVFPVDIEGVLVEGAEKLANGKMHLQNKDVLLRLKVSPDVPRDAVIEGVGIKAGFESGLPEALAAILSRGGGVAR